MLAADRRMCPGFLAVSITVFCIWFKALVQSIQSDPGTLSLSQERVQSKVGCSYRMEPIVHNRMLYTLISVHTYSSCNGGERMLRDHPHLVPTWRSEARSNQTLNTG